MGKVLVNAEKPADVAVQPERPLSREEFLKEFLLGVLAGLGLLLVFLAKAGFF